MTQPGTETAVTGTDAIAKASLRLLTTGACNPLDPPLNA